MKKKIVEKAKSVTVQQVKVFTEEVIEEYDKNCSSYTIKRILKKADLLWKRMRNSLKSQRDEVLFKFFKEELQLLRNQALKNEIDLYFFDEVGFNLKPNVPYAWQEKGETILLPAIRGSDKNSFTVLGLLNVENQDFDGDLLYSSSANTECVINFLERFSLKVQKKGRKTVLILDNATIHTANLVKQKAKIWRERGLFLQYIPAYSPELNLIEILWKQMKHFWLKPKDYLSVQTLENAIIRILNAYGQEYQINFA